MYILNIISRHYATTLADGKEHDFGFLKTIGKIKEKS